MTAMAIDTLLAEAQDLQRDAVRFRRTLHEHPEVGLDLPFTQERVLEALDGLGLASRPATARRAWWRRSTAPRPGPTILLRGDMDALPMPEDTGLEFSSRIDDAMHACGHDLHVTMLVGAARLLGARRAELAGSVRFMFQPGEEGHHGARFMLDEGLLDAPAGPSHHRRLRPPRLLGAPGGHDRPEGRPADGVGRPVPHHDRGQGGHASAPHQALDPVPIACEIVQALQTFVTRSIDVFDPGVITVGRITAGTHVQRHPGDGRALRHDAGRVRADPRQAHRRLRRVAEGIAAAHGTAVEVEIEHGYPVTVNDRDFADFAHDVAADLLGRRARRAGCRTR